MFLFVLLLEAIPLGNASQDGYTILYIPINNINIHAMHLSKYSTEHYLLYVPK